MARKKGRSQHRERREGSSAEAASTPTRTEEVALEGGAEPEEVKVEAEAVAAGDAEAGGDEGEAAPEGAAEPEEAKVTPVEAEAEAEGEAEAAGDAEAGGDEGEAASEGAAEPEAVVVGAKEASGGAASSHPVFDAVEIPLGDRGHPLAGALARGWDLYVLGDYPGAREAVAPILSASDAPRSLRRGAEQLGASTGVELYTLIAGVVLVLFFLFVLSRVY